MGFLCICYDVTRCIAGVSLNKDVTNVASIHFVSHSQPSHCARPMLSSICIEYTNNNLVDRIRILQESLTKRRMVQENTKKEHLKSTDASQLPSFACPGLPIQY